MIRSRSARRSSEPAFLAVPVADFELSEPGNLPQPNAVGQIHLLIRRHGRPIGALAMLQPGPRGPADIAAEAAHCFADVPTDGTENGATHNTIAAPETGAGAGPYQAPLSTELVSVIICTLGQDPKLAQAARSVLTQTHRNLELLVIDNDPESGGTAAALTGINDPRLRIVAEPRRGLSVARNTGVAAARGSLVAFTDDDALADSGWLEALTSPFRDHAGIACVTGLVLPAELSTRAQVWFEEFGAFDKGFTRLVWSADDTDPTVSSLGVAGTHSALFPYSCGVFGSGNNMAFRAEFLREHGLFDVALGAGTLARGGEDLDAFLMVMLAGAILIYEPRALIRHFARRDVDGLRRQMFGYGVGMCAVIAKHATTSPGSAMRIGHRLPGGFWKLLSPASEKNERRTDDFPPQMVRAELAGYLAGPVLYVRSRRAARRRGLR